MKPQTFIFFGRSGCGKGTQAGLLKEHLRRVDPTRDIISVETGRELRSFIEEYSTKGNHSAELVRKVLDSGDLLPEFMPIWVWTKYFIEHVKGDEHFVLDGLSRRPSEAPVLDGAFKFYNRKQPTVLLIDVAPKWSMGRLLARGRHDDSKEEIQKRLDWFDEQVSPTLEFFRSNPSYRFLTINGEQSIEAGHREILKATNV